MAKQRAKFRDYVVTLAELGGYSICYPEERLRSLAGGKTGMPMRKVLALKGVSDYDKSWLIWQIISHTPELKYQNWEDVFGEDVYTIAQTAASRSQLIGWHGGAYCTAELRHVESVFYSNPNAWPRKKR